MIQNLLKALVLLLLTMPLCGNSAEGRSEEESQQILESAYVWIEGIEGIDLSEDQNGISLKGTIYRKSDYDRIQKLIKKFPEIKNRAEISKKLSAKFPRANVRSRESKIEPSIYFEMILVEVRKSALDRAGPRILSPLGATLNAGSFKVDPVKGFLDFSLQNGDAKVHSKQVLIIQNGQKGEFHIGGEFPVKTVGTHFSKVEWKEFGFIIKCLPKLQAPPFIHLNIDSEISDIDSGTFVDGLPVISKKHLKTQVFAKLDEMVAIGGTVRSVEAKIRDQIPGLSLIPGLGRLFESDDFKRHRSEAYIFISPKKLEQGWVP
ncbi:MAG: type II and III secretion system protein [Deltaproteobacteria bacterium]|nr:type II and III secretion system protein [Deltaproteobacteria bacterium]